MGIKKSWSMAPKLRRVCVLSAPVTGESMADGTPGPNVNDILNKNMNMALQWTKDNMSTKGFLPEAKKTTSAAAHLAYGDYFDLRR